MTEDVQQHVTRRTFVRVGAIGGLAAIAPAARRTPTPPAEVASVPRAAAFDLEEATIGALQRDMETGERTSVGITQAYLDRIATLDRAGPSLNQVLETNPDALAIAGRLDRERHESGPRGPLHGIPLLLKDNIDTGDRMMTTAGSLALVGAPASRDAFVVERLRAAGAVILGKTNLSEWANFRSTQSSSGWSGRGGQGKNPYALDRSPCGSSAGSGAATAANFAAAAVGTETDGSVVCPASANGIVGLKPTLGLVSRTGIVPIAHSQDTAGPMARTVTDAAILLGAMVGADPADAVTRTGAADRGGDYRRFLDPDGLRGARIGVARGPFFGYSPEADAIVEDAVAAMRDAGATVVDPVEIPHASDYGDAEFEVLLYEFKADLNRYLATRRGVPVRSLADVIAFNTRHADRELGYFGQELLERAEAKGPLTEAEYVAALEQSKRLAGPEGIDAALAADRLDALVAPTGSPAWPIDLINGDHFLGASSSPAAVAGYTSLSVPAGYSFGLPVGLTFIGGAFTEPTLLRLGYAFEQLTRVRRAPTFRRTVGWS